jgi:hypothetical protein
VKRHATRGSDRREPLPVKTRKSRPWTIQTPMLIPFDALALVPG